MLEEVVSARKEKSLKIWRNYCLMGHRQE